MNQPLLPVALFVGVVLALGGCGSRSRTPQAPPVVLPLASLQYRKSAVMASFMPGPKGNGNVLFLFGRIAY